MRQVVGVVLVVMAVGILRVLFGGGPGETWALGRGGLTMSGWKLLAFFLLIALSMGLIQASLNGWGGGRAVVGVAIILASAGWLSSSPSEDEYLSSHPAHDSCLEFEGLVEEFGRDSATIQDVREAAEGFRSVARNSDYLPSTADGIAQGVVDFVEASQAGDEVSADLAYQELVETMGRYSFGCDNWESRLGPKNLLAPRRGSL